MANFQGNRINPTRFSSGQIKFHIIAFPLSIFMILPVVFLIGNAFKPLGELFKFPPTIFAHNPTLESYELSRFYRYSNVKILLELNDSYCAYSSS